MQGGRDVVGSAARAPERVARQFDRSAVSDKAAIDSPDGRPERSKRLQVLRERTNAAEPDVGVPTISGAPADGGAGNMPTCALTPRDDLTVGTNSNSSASVAEPTMPEAAKPQAPRPAVSGDSIATFHCPEWTRSMGTCCPEGAVRHECPALARTLA